MRLAEYLDPDRAVIGLATEGVEDTLDALLHHLQSCVEMEQPDRVRRAVVDRENSHTTSLVNGGALPHATVGGIREPLQLLAP